MGTAAASTLATETATFPNSGSIFRRNPRTLGTWRRITPAGKILTRTQTRKTTTLQGPPKGRRRLVWNRSNVFLRVIRLDEMEMRYPVLGQNSTHCANNLPCFRDGALLPFTLRPTHHEIRKRQSWMRRERQRSCHAPHLLDISRPAEVGLDGSMSVDGLKMWVYGGAVLLHSNPDDQR